MCFKSLESTLISPHSTQNTRLICQCHHGSTKAQKTVMRYLVEVAIDSWSVKHHMTASVVVYDGSQSFRTQFDDADHEIHHNHDFAFERLSHVQGGNKGEDAVSSRHSGRFETYEESH